MLKTPEQWAKEDGIIIMDPDGWRMKDSPPFDQPIPKSEYDWRVIISTIRSVGRFCRTT